MARKWTPDEEQKYKEELVYLYERENRTIGEIATLLRIAEQTVFQRLQRLGIPTHPERKSKYLNQRQKIHLPHVRSPALAEFFGIMLGDGHVSHFQTIVTLGDKEIVFVEYVCSLIEKLFLARPKVGVRTTGYRDIYLGSVVLTKWLRQNGLVRHKVKSQVGAPEWIFTKKVYMQAFVRGFFDTDGSVYKLKHGIQVSFCNESKPLLLSLQRMLATLGYAPSVMSSSKVYITRVPQVKRFFREVAPANKKHQNRYKKFIARVGTQVVNEGRL